MSASSPRRASAKNHSQYASWRSAWERSSPWHRAAVIALIVLGSIWRCYHVSLPITQEEATAFTRFVHLSVGELLTTSHVVAVHPLYVLLMKGAVKVLGVHLWTIRLPALFAGIAVMPVAYFTVRSLFNRHIALMMLAFIATSSGLVEVGALARGYSWTWLLMILGLGQARAYAKTERTGPAVGLAVLGALGVRFVPAMGAAALAVFLWAAYQVISAYDSSVWRRLLKLGAAFLLFVLLVVLSHLPILLAHGVDGLLNDPSSPELGWNSFVAAERKGAMDLWSWMVAPLGLALTIAFGVGVLLAIYLSARYRALVGALLLACVVVSLGMRVQMNAEDWSFVLLVFHLGGAIALFQLAKVVGKLRPASTDGQRGGLALALVLLIMLPVGLSSARGRIPRHGEAARVGAWLRDHAGDNDRVWVEPPLDTPVEFHLIAEGIGRGLLEPAQPLKGRLYVLVGTAADQTVDQVLDHSPYRGLDPSSLVKVEDWPRLEIFATP